MIKYTSMALIVGLSLAACGGSDSDGETAEGAQEQKNDDTPSNEMDDTSEEGTMGDEARPASENPDLGSNDGAEATETNAAPAVCDDDSDCPEGISCMQFEEDGPGFCDVQETNVEDEPMDGADDTSLSPSLGAPAPCESDDDCPEGIACARFDDSGPGFCDVNEHIVEPE